MALPDSLQTLVDDGVIDSIEARLMSGKEAAVFVVLRRGERLAAKVYKARDRRTFKATADYTEGRNQTRNTRDKRAMGKRTNYGRELLEDSWRDMEYRALYGAMHAGVRVPKPIMLYEEVLLMELVVDEHGEPASRLADFELQPEQAQPILFEIYKQVRLLLGTGKVHGDLSAFNILMAAGGPTIIDLPQVVDASGNNQAREILRRDLANVTEHLAKFDARLLRFRHCGDALWAHFQRGTLDEATQPQEGGMRGDRTSGRRAQLAERGRMGRGDAGRGDAGRGDAGRGDARPGDLRQAMARLDTTRSVPQPDGPRHQGARRDDRRPDLRPQQAQGPRDDRRPDLRPQQGQGPRHDDRRPDLRAQQQGRPQGPRHDERRPDLRAQGHQGPRQEEGERSRPHRAPIDAARQGIEAGAQDVRQQGGQRGPQQGGQRGPQHGAPQNGQHGASQGPPRQDRPQKGGRHDRPAVQVDYVRRSKPSS